MTGIAVPALTKRALCADTDPELFFPDDRGGGVTGGEAKKVCARCPARDECLVWALATNQRFGIWGGKSPEQRAEIRKGRRAS